MMRLRTKLGLRSYWLITRHTISGMDVFTTRPWGESRVLVVFSFQEEAEMFFDLGLAASKDGWNVRQTSAGELASILYGTCSDAQEVLLDPLPEIGGESAVDPVMLPRNNFLLLLLGEAVPSNLHGLPSQPHRSQERKLHHGTSRSNI